MKKIFSIALLAGLLLTFEAFAQNYPQVVIYETSDDVSATFTTVGADAKSKNVQDNAVKSLFYTLFDVGVDGVNDGKPLIVNDNKSYIETFFSSRIPFFVKSVTETVKPARNANKIYQGTYAVTVVYSNLIKDLERNKLYEQPKSLSDKVEEEDGMVLPTIMVVPYKKDGETYASLLASDFDKRIAVSKVQDAFESQNITTVDVQARLDAVKRNAQFGENDANSNDKQLIMNSGADVYVVVDIHKDVNAQGARVSLIMKAYLTNGGDILASKDAITARFATNATDALCSYAVQDNVPAFLEDIKKNFTGFVTKGKKVALQFAIDGASAMSMSDRVGEKNYPLSNLITQWVRKNSHKGKFHLRGNVGEAIIYDYVMIPPKAADGLMMDAFQFSLLIEAWLNDEVGVPCSSRIDGDTIYITIL